MKKFIETLKFVLSYAGGIKSKIFLVFIVNTFNIILRIITPIVSAQLIIKLTDGNFDELIYFGVVLFVITLIENQTFYYTRKRMTYIYQRLSNAITKDVAQNMLKITNEGLDKAGSGKFLQRITSDTYKISDIFYVILDLLGDLFVNVGNILAIFIINYMVGILVIIMTIILFVIEQIRSNKKEKLDKIVRKTNDRLYTTISELVRGSRDIKMLNSEKDYLSKFDKDVDDYSNKYIKLRNVGYNFRFL